MGRDWQIRGSVLLSVFLVAVACSLCILPPNLSAQSQPQQSQQSASAYVRARQKLVKAAEAAVYHNRWNLDNLPVYKPQQQVSGTIRIRGNDGEAILTKLWARGFQKYQPGVKFSIVMKSSELGIPSLYTGTGDLAALGRAALWDELLAYERVFHHDPLQIIAVTGAYSLPGPVTWALGIFVNKHNPIDHLTLEQLDGIFGSQRAGGWQGTKWITTYARGPEQNIRTWGQLGLRGQWKNKAIDIYGYNLRYHFPRAFEKRVFHGADLWNDRLHEFTNYVTAESGLHLAGTDIIKAISKDPYGIGYTGMIFLTPEMKRNVKPLAIARKAGGPYIPLTIDNLHNRTYPLLRNIYFYLNRDPGKPVSPKLREFLRFILSRQGQRIVMLNGKYEPLPRKTLQEQRAKLQ